MIFKWDFVVLILLDLSATFDAIDHSSLLSRLESWVDLKANVLKWYQSYLSDRKFLVKLGNFTSSAAPLTCGLPQGPILAPSLFSLHMLPLGSIQQKHGVSFHFYADDTQIYLPIKRNNSTAITSLPNENSQCISPELESLSVLRSSRVRNLGVLVDQHEFDQIWSTYSGYGKYSDPLTFFTLCYIAAIC